VVKCLEELGVRILRVDNDEAQGHCPAHVRITGKQDRHPSWSVNTESGAHNCFSCGFRGPFYTIVKEMLVCSDDDAISWCKARGSIDRAKKILFGEGVYVHELAEQYTEADLALFVDVPEWVCHERDLEPWAVDDYGIRWDAEHGNWITPIREPFTNRLMGWQEKGQDTRYFRNRPKSVEKSTTLFGLNELDGRVAVVVESPLDCPRIYTATEQKIAVSTFGVRISDTQLDVLEEAGIELLICALDNDRDGNTQSDDLRRRVRGRMRLKYWDYGDSDAKDPGEQTDDEILWSLDHAYSSVLWKRA